MGNLAAAAAALKNKPPATTKQNNSSNIPGQQPQTIYQKRLSLMQNLQTAIKTERHAQGLTQRQLARKAGMSQGTITRAECHGWVSIWTMLRIIDALGKSIQVV